MSLLPHPAFFRATVEKSGTVLAVYFSKTLNLSTSEGLAAKFPLLFPLLEEHEESFRTIVKEISTLGSRGEKSVCLLAARELIVKKGVYIFFC